MPGKKYEDLLPGKKPLKAGLAGMVFWFLGRGFQAAAALDGKIAEEVAGWPEAFILQMKIDPAGPAMVMGKKNGKLLYLGSRETEAHLSVHFKNLEAALRTLLGLSGIDRAFAEHRFTMKGDIIAYGMPLVRCLYRVEAYLFPSFIARRILKRMPVKERSILRVYLKTLLNV